MKVGIITFHRALNYGAVLQAYALGKALRNNNIDAKILDYRNKHTENNYEIKIIYPGSNIIGMISNLLTFKYRNEKNNKFKQFISDYLYLTDSALFTSAQLSGTECDAYITGSDQVWNYKCSNKTSFSDKSYFLDFVKDGSKKNSYAASFGFSDIPLEYKEQYKMLLEKYNKIAVREKQGAEIIKNLLGREVPVVLDPTLLLDIYEWDNISIKYKQQEKYVLMYLMWHSPSLVAFAKKLAEENGFKLLFISDSILKRSGIRNIHSVGPREWLGLFQNAAYIVTNSFHGAAFAINFNKELFVEYLPKTSKVNSRLENILGMFGLKNRLIKYGVNEESGKMIDYKKVNKTLKEEREISMKYLMSIVDNRNE